VECLVFQQNKVETIKASGLLQPLFISSQHWEEVSMDFITILPKSEGKSVIMVVVDRLIVIDRDLIFAGNFWTELFSYLGTQLAHISYYHP